MANITTAAQSTVAAYAATLAKAADPAIPLAEVVSSLAEFYLPGFTAFTLGNIFSFTDDDIARKSMHSELTRFQSLGLGNDFRLANSRIEPVSDTSAICWLDWTLSPAGEAPWKFTIVFGFRVAEGRPSGLVGGWEWINADHEFTQILARDPKVMSAQPQ